LTLQYVLQACPREGDKVAKGNREKKMQLNIVKMNGSDGWPTHVSENKTVYVGYTCFATLLMI